jgi:hypothetical protein
MDLLVDYCSAVDSMVEVKTVYEANNTLTIHAAPKKRATSRSPWLSHGIQNHAG